VQLCAQVLCLEKMTGQRITQCALWYWQTHKREPVEINAALRKRTLGLISAINELFTGVGTPRAIYGKHCKACSLLDICNPLLSQQDPSIDYTKNLFNFYTDGLR
jgi:CRISPR-associated exonuclease Cas4